MERSGVRVIITDESARLSSHWKRKQPRRVRLPSAPLENIQPSDAWPVPANAIGQVDVRRFRGEGGRMYEQWLFSETDERWYERLLRADD